MTASRRVRGCKRALRTLIRVDSEMAMSSVLSPEVLQTIDAHGGRPTIGRSARSTLKPRSNTRIAAMGGRLRDVAGSRLHPCAPQVDHQGVRSHYDPSRRAWLWSPGEVMAPTCLQRSSTALGCGIERNRRGRVRLFRPFSWPYAILSALAAETAGSIDECGELGHCLAQGRGTRSSMPYHDNDELPSALRRHLPEHAEDIYRAAFNHAFSAHAGDPRQEEAAHRPSNVRL